VNTRRKSKRRGGRSSLGIRLVGLGGVACITWSVFGLVLSLSNREAATVTNRVAEQDHGSGDLIEHEKNVVPVSARPVPYSYYPLHVGRYWVYKHVDNKTGTEMEIERRIVRRERRDDRELFFFDDGSMVYDQDGKIFEIGPEGGVNVVPIRGSRDDVPYIYRTQGLHIEKRVGTTSTDLVLGERQFADCLEVITRFRRVEQDASRSMAYSSYYSRGVGLVARAQWLNGRHSEPTMILQDFGPNGL
jgi:hypothetical protein